MCTALHAKVGWKLFAPPRSIVVLACQASCCMSFELGGQIAEAWGLETPDQ